MDLIDRLIDIAGWITLGVITGLVSMIHPILGVIFVAWLLLSK